MAANIFGAKPDPFAPKPAAANPFGGAATNAFGAKPAASPFGAPAAAAAAVPAGPPIEGDAQVAAIISAVNVMHKYTGIAGDDGSLAELEGKLLPFFRDDAALDTFAFRQIVYNRRDAAAAPTRGRLVTKAEWDRELRERPFDEQCSPRVPIMPVALDGFVGHDKVQLMDSATGKAIVDPATTKPKTRVVHGLAERFRMQEKATEANAAYVASMQVALHRITTACEESKRRVDAIYDRQAELLQRVLTVAGKVDAVVLRGKPEDSAEGCLHAVIGRVRAYLLEEAHLKERFDRLVRHRASAAGVDAGWWRHEWRGRVTGCSPFG